MPPRRRLPWSEAMALTVARGQGCGQRPEIHSKWIRQKILRAPSLLVRGRVKSGAALGSRTPDLRITSPFECVGRQFDDLPERLALPLVAVSFGLYGHAPSVTPSYPVGSRLTG